MIRRLLLPWVFALALCGADEAQSQSQAQSQTQHTAPTTAAGPAGTAAANPGGLTAAEARHVIDLLQDPQQRARLIETLRAIAKTPAALEPEKPAASAAPPVALAPNSLGAQLLTQ